MAPSTAAATAAALWAPVAMMQQVPGGADGAQALGDDMTRHLVDAVEEPGIVVRVCSVSVATRTRGLRIYKFDRSSLLSS